MGFMSLRPNESAGASPVIRHIKVGRYSDRRTKTGVRMPEQLDHFLVTYTYEDPNDKGANPNDSRDRRNLKVDDAMMKALLERQMQLDPSLPSDKLRLIEVRLPFMSDMSDCLSGEFKAPTRDGSGVICRGKVGGTALWDGRQAPDNLNPERLFPASHIQGSPDKNGHLWHIKCDGLSCVLAKENRVPRNSDYPEFPYCGLQWDLLLHMDRLSSTFGMVRFRSTSENGYRFTVSTLQKLHELLGGEVLPSGVSLLLRMTIKRNKHKGMSTLVYLDANEGSYSLIRGFAEQRKQLMDARTGGGLMLEAGKAVEETHTLMPVDEIEEDAQPAAAVESVEDAVYEDGPDEEVEEAPAADDGNHVGTYQELKAFVIEVTGGDEDGAKELLKEAWKAACSNEPSFTRMGDVDGLSRDEIAHLQDLVENACIG